MMSGTELTTEEQETIRKSKDPSVIKSANGTTHTTDEATENVCDLNMSALVQLLKEALRSILAGKTCAKKTVIRLSDIQVSHHSSSRMGKHRL